MLFFLYPVDHVLKISTCTQLIPWLYDVFNWQGLYTMVTSLPNIGVVHKAYLVSPVLLQLVLFSPLCPMYAKSPLNLGAPRSRAVIQHDIKCSWSICIADSHFYRGSIYHSCTSSDSLCDGRRTNTHKTLQDHGAIQHRSRWTWFTHAQSITTT